MRLTGKVALVSGGSRGIGEAIVELFAREGARVSFCGRDRRVGIALERRLRRRGYDVAYFRCDISKEEQVKTLVALAMGRYARLDILVNNAGTAAFGPVETMPLEAWQRVLDVNVTGMFLATKFCIPHLRRTAGTIVNLGSTYGMVGAAGFAAYALSKAAAINFSKSLALELAPDRIRVNALCPGATETPAHKASLLEAPDPEEAGRALVSKHPIGRLATPMEQAQGALFLVSDEASFVTGSALMVDGGYTAI